MQSCSLYVVTLKVELIDRGTRSPKLRPLDPSHKGCVNTMCGVSTWLIEDSQVTQFIQDLAKADARIQFGMVRS